MVRFLGRCFGAWLLVVSPTIGHAGTSTVLTSPMVDPTLYRDGEVKRLSGAFGPWQVVCDEISRLKQRYCSLKTAILTDGGTVAGRLDMSTGDDGQPVALMHLPLGLLVRSGVEVVFVDPAAPPKAARPATRPTPARHLNIVTCDGRECLALWTLAADEVQRLQQVTRLDVRYRLARGELTEPFAPNRPDRETIVTGHIAADGYTSAIRASLR